MDEGKHPSRRLMMLGGAAMMTSAANLQSDDAAPLLFKDGLLANNDLASYFKKTPSDVTWPSIQIVAPNGDRIKLEQFRGKTLAVSLWAEWCTPCLQELPGIAVLRSQTTGPKFELLPILTSTEYERPRDADDLLKRLKIRELAIYMDGSGTRDRLIRSLGRTHEDPTGAVPCTILIDSQGRVRGRMLGGALVTAADGKEYSMWMTNIGKQFCDGLAMGALDQLPI